MSEKTTGTITNGQLETQATLGTQYRNEDFNIWATQTCMSWFWPSI